MPLTKLARLTVIFFSLLMLYLASAPTALAQTQTWEGGTCTSSGVATIQGLECLLGNVLSVAITVIGLAGFVMMIYGSMVYMLSGGQSKGAETARNTLTYAIVGLVVALSSFFILNIIAAFTGVEVITNFTIPGPNPLPNPQPTL